MIIFASLSGLGVSFYQKLLPQWAKAEIHICRIWGAGSVQGAGDEIVGVGCFLKKYMAIYNFYNKQMFLKK